MKKKSLLHHFPEMTGNKLRHFFKVYGQTSAASHGSVVVPIGSFQIRLVVWATDRPLRLVEMGFFFIWIKSLGEEVRAGRGGALQKKHRKKKEGAALRQKSGCY